MSRRYHDPVEVVAADPADPADPPCPRAFRWRRRNYRVSAVLARWIEAEQWWRLAGFGPADCSTDAVVWRVEASSRSGPPGVFELLCRTDIGRTAWFLVRTHD